MVEAINSWNDSRLWFINHMVDRPCIGKCFAYANYEPPARQFRVRVKHGSPIVTDSPGGGGPWQILSVANGKISALGKPFSAIGEVGDFVPGKINKIGNATQILPDELRIRLFTGYFHVSVPLRVGWWEGGLALAQTCFGQTGHGFAPVGAKCL